MDKKTADELKKTLKKVKKFPYFVYFPMKKGLGGDEEKGKTGIGGSAPLLEFTKTKAERDKRIKELKAKRGNKFAGGIVEEGDEGSLVFQCVKHEPDKMARDLKQMAKKVPALKDCTITTVSEADEQTKQGQIDKGVTKSVSDDIHEESAALKDKFGKIKKKDVREQALSALDQLDTYARLVSEAQDGYERYDTEGPGLKTYFGKLLDEIPQRIQGEKTKIEQADVALKRAESTDDAKGAKTAKEQRLAAEHEIENLTTLKRQLEEQWGQLMAVRAGCRDHVSELVEALDGAVTLRDKVDGPKSLGRFVASLGDIKDKLAVVQGEVYRFGEKMVEMQRRIHDHALTDPSTLIDLPDMPSQVVGSDVSVKVGHLERLHDTATTLLASPHRAELLAKAKLVDAVLALPVPESVGDEPAKGKAYLTGIARMVMASKVSAAKIKGRMDKIGTDGDKTAAFADALVKGGSHGTLELSSFVQGAQEWVVEVQSKYESVAAFNKALKEAGRTEVDATDLLAFIKFDQDLVGGSVVTKTTHTGEREVVKLTSTGRVIVVGGGPIGLMSAIEATKQGGKVTVFEGRGNEYTRQNVLKLTEGTVDRLERYGFYKLLGLTGYARTNVKVADLEDTLFTIAQQMGIRVVKGKGVSELTKDPETGEVLCLVGGVHESADLVIVAVGSGVKNANKYAGDVVMSEQLGISIKEFELTDHVISANLDKSSKKDVPTTDKTTEDKKNWQVVLETGTQKYVLAQLTPEEYDRAKDSHDKLKQIILDRAKVNPEFAGLDVSAVGRFEVVIQRAEQFVSDDMRAVVIGDSAATPHPEAGSGTNTGALETDAVIDLVRGLVDSAKERFGGRKRKVDESLGEYEERMEEIVDSMSRKGMANMLSVRQRRANLSRRALQEWRATLGDAPPKDPAIDQLLKDMGAKIPALSPASKDALYDDWQAAKRRGDLIDALNDGLEKALAAGKQRQSTDPSTRESLLDSLLRTLVYIPS